MKQSLSALLEKASVSLPPQHPGHNRWGQFAPVVKQLQGNGYTTLAAVDWLIGEGEIQPQDRSRAYRALIKTTTP